MPYISLWYKTNVAVFQPDIHGVRLSPIADFTFLKDLSRPSAPGREMSRRCLLFASLAILVPIVASASGRYDPRLRFQTISTTRFDIHYHQGEEGQARRLAALAERVASELDTTLGRPSGRVQVILVDQTDLVERVGDAIPFNTIEIAAASPGGASLIGNTDDWLRLVFTHEYTHIVHLSRGQGWIGGLRRVFGRLPLLYPNLYLPKWQIEGIAVHEESLLTGQGRVPDKSFRAIADVASAASRFEPLDRASGCSGRLAVGPRAIRVRRAISMNFSPPAMAKRRSASSRTRRQGVSRSSAPARSRRSSSARSASCGASSKPPRTSRSLPLARPCRGLPVSASPSAVRDLARTAGCTTPSSTRMAFRRCSLAIATPRRRGRSPIDSLARGSRLPGREIVFDQVEIENQVGLQSDLYAIRSDGAVSGG